MDLISVIVPVFKVEKYLNRCVESIINQLYTNLEIILVDDGSPDNCPKMCDDWAKVDCRIKVIHKENGGLSDARNSGLRIATGKYISFIDSDDWVHPKFIDYLYNAIQTKNADISACGVQFIHNEEKENAQTEPTNYFECTPIQVFLNEQSNIKFRAVAWNKLYRADLIIGEKFPVGKLHEDEFLIYKIIDKATNLVYVDTVLYYYFQRDNSIMNTVSPKHLDGLDAHWERLEFFKKYPDLYKKEKALFCLACINYNSSSYFLDKSQKALFKNHISKLRNKVSFSFKEFMAYSLKEKVFIFGSKYFRNLLSRYFIFKEKSI